MSPLKICVFGSSSSKTSQNFSDISFLLGESIAKKGLICINGGGMGGCMGGVNRGARAQNGEVIGVIHEKFCVDGDEDKLISNMIVSKGEDLGERKQLLLDNCDCILVLPGGTGTFDEFWESVCAKSLNMKGLTQKPISIVNIDGYYDGFIMQLERAHSENLLYLHPSEYFHVGTTTEESLNWCLSHFNDKGEYVKAQSVKDWNIEFQKTIRKKERNLNDLKSTSLLDSSWFKTASIFTIGTLCGILISRSIKK